MRRAADGRTFAKVDPGDRAGDLPGGAVGRGRRAARPSRTAKQAQPAWAATTVGEARRHPAADRAADARASRRDRRAGRARDRQVDRRTRSAKPTRRSRWASSSPARAPLLRPDDHQRRAEQAAMVRAPAARRRRPDHRRQHADRQRRLEGVSGAALRQRRDPEGVRRHAAVGLGVRRAGARGRRARRRLPRRCTASARRRARRSSSIPTSRSSASPARARSAGGSPRRPDAAWPRSASSSAARTR